MSDEMATCRFCGLRRPVARMFVWRSGVWECLDLLDCESAERVGKQRAMLKIMDGGKR